MNFTALLKKSCYIFGIIIILYSLLVICFGGGMGMNPVSVALIYPFSFVISFANGVVKHTNLNTGFKLVSHFSLVTLSLILFVYLPSNSNFSGGTKMVAFVLYVILYMVIASIYLAFASRKKKKANKNSEYKNVF